jgi:translation initiation factor IF-2
MIIAVNKMDKPGANVDKVKEQLATHNVLTEEWGGDAILVPVSAHTGKGIDKLLEMILLVAEMNGYKANPNKEAQGAIIDAHSDAKVGALVTVLVQSGTLRVGDTILAGVTSGKVKRMTDENGKSVKAATPGMPVQVLGFSEVPKAGDAVHVVDDKLTREVVMERKEKERVTKTKAGSKNASEIDAVAKLNDAAKKQLNLIIKGDVSGSVEAIIQSVNNITSDEVKVNVISSGVGVVNDNDINMCNLSSGIIIAFNVKTSPTAAIKAKSDKIDIHSFNVIYRIFDFVTEQMVRRFTPKFNEIYYGKAEVLAIFKSSALGQIAGSMVKDGKMLRGARVRLWRGKVKIGEFNIDSLKIKKDDQKEIAAGFECGIKLDTDTEVMVGDIIECYGLEQLPIMYGGKKYEF